MKRFWDLMDEYIENYWGKKPLSAEVLLSQCETEKDRQELQEQIEEWTATQIGIEKKEIREPIIAKDNPLYNSQETA